MPVKNRCQCPQPPGGVVECEPNQVAMCIIENGQARHVCATPPAGSAADKISWLYRTITGVPKDMYEISAVDRITLGSGFFRRGNGIVLNFSLPDEIKDILRNPDDDEQGIGGGGTPNPVPPRGPFSRFSSSLKVKKKIRATKSGKLKVRKAAKKIKTR